MIAETGGNGVNEMKEIYLVHDQLESHWVRQHYLESAGYKVTPFDGGDACLHALSERLPDLVLLDVLIEGRNGFEVCASLRADHSAEELPVVLCSEIYREEAFRLEAERAGAQRYVLKPCPLEELVAIVSGVLEGRGDVAA